MKSLELFRTSEKNQKIPYAIRKTLNELRSRFLGPDEIGLEELSHQVLEKLKNDIQNGEVKKHSLFGEVHSVTLAFKDRRYTCEALYTQPRNTMELRVSDSNFNKGRRVFELFRGMTQGEFTVDLSSLSQIPLRKEVKIKMGLSLQGPYRKGKYLNFLTS